MARWEPPKKQKISQCKNCQRFGHAKINCNMNYRCIKCGDNHLPDKCPITDKDKREMLKCANYKQSGHPADYRGCPFYKFAVSKLTKVNTQPIRNTTQNPQKISRQVNNNYPTQISQRTKEHSKIFSQGPIHNIGLTIIAHSPPLVNIAFPLLHHHNGGQNSGTR